mmetsp:Transcript_30818/g.91548  ORF Transcript_30818/g.91548 Transcript_30818/m.91548 type:complete len:240 (-) Transcript_30818:1255-1974(-)
MLPAASHVVPCHRSFSGPRVLLTPLYATEEAVAISTRNTAFTSTTGTVAFSLAWTASMSDWPGNSCDHGGAWGLVESTPRLSSMANKICESTCVPPPPMAWRRLDVDTGIATETSSVEETMRGNIHANLPESIRPGWTWVPVRQSGLLNPCTTALALRSSFPCTERSLAAPRRELREKACRPKRPPWILCPRFGPDFRRVRAKRRRCSSGPCCLRAAMPRQWRWMSVAAQWACMRSCWR